MSEQIYPSTAELKSQSDGWTLLCNVLAILVLLASPALLVGLYRVVFW